MRVLLLIFALSTTPALAQTETWPLRAKTQLGAAGARLQSADTVDERVAVLREVEKILSANSDSPDARLMAALIGQKATIEAGPGVMLDVLAKLAISGHFKDESAYAEFIAPLLENVAKMQEDNTLLGATAIKLDNAVKKLDNAAAKVGLPSVAAVISKAAGENISGSAITKSLSRLTNFAKLARTSPDVAAMDEKATKAFINSLVSVLSNGAGPAISGPAFVVTRDVLVWQNEMISVSSDTLNLVANTMETGRFDQEYFNKINKKANELSKGPWGNDTAKDFFKSLCKSVPVFGLWCNDAFQVVDKIFSTKDCKDLTCDCGYVGGGAMFASLYIVCLHQEQNLVMECKATNKISGLCAVGAKGPGASN